MLPRQENRRLIPMTVQERVTADYRTMNLTAGPHPMKLLRDRLPNIWRASDLPQRETRFNRFKSPGM